ncbi:hypothetical protein PVK06_008000 [Gossypium arboreum]|uniref:FGAR-AT PurM N-terminal-like domain-containing protein n=1 Tax=Gossypium arboreum TaxID=29729 RepID=A0ABR0QJK1_GOSAR|nr:hypothetical protein PVK06_008000 [Gossypium arboreum]
MVFIGTINDEGHVVLVNSVAIKKSRASRLLSPPPTVNLELEKVLGDMPQKSFEFKRVAYARESLDVAPGITVTDLSKRLPLANVAVIAQNYVDLTGGAYAIGGQPIKGLLDPKAMARLAVGEALKNLVWANVTSLSDVKASKNWMYVAKREG